jgi:hypothetical protein
MQMAFNLDNYETVEVRL